MAAAAACCGVLALATVPAVLVSTVAGGCDVGNQSAGSGSWLATAYGPPWGGIQGDGMTATGINLTAGPPVLEVAVDPSMNAQYSLSSVPLSTISASFFFSGIMSLSIIFGLRGNMTYVIFNAFYMADHPLLYQ